MLVAASVRCEPTNEEAPWARPIGVEWMTALLQARKLHHLADVYLADGDIDAAVARVRGILSIRFRVAAAATDDVLLDACARLGKLMVGVGKQREALRLVEEGIAAAARESNFLANLDAVRRDILRREAERAESGDEADALWGGGHRVAGPVLSEGGAGPAGDSPP